MKYVSPLTFLSEDLAGHTGEVTAYEIQLVKRKLLAEAELSDQKTVIRKGVEYSKEDIIYLFDKLGGNLRMDYHQRIYDSRPLREFLEAGMYDLSEPIFKGDEEQEFLDFVRPWFIPVWSDEMLIALRQRRSDCLLYLLQQTDKIFDEMMLIEVLQPFEARLEDLDNSAVECGKRIEQTKSWNGHEVDQYINPALIKFFNALPYTFSSFRNSYMIAMINLGVFIYNSGNKGSALAYAKIGVNLDCDDYYLNQMKDRVEIFGNKKKTSTSTSSSDSSWLSGGRIVWIVLVALSAILRLGTCNSHSSSDSFTNNSTFTEYLKTAEESRRTIAAASEILRSDSVKIAYAALDEKNEAFLNSLVKALRASSHSLVPVKYPAEDQPVIGMEVGSLQSAIDKGWKSKEEMQYANSQSLPLMFFNLTRTPMVLLYNDGPELKVLKINAGDSVFAKVHEGRLMTIPFFGSGWYPNKKIYSNKTPKTLLAKGWFKNCTDPYSRISGHVNILKVVISDPLNTDRIVFTYPHQDKDYFFYVQGENIIRDYDMN
ncbi:MAG: hypothetical protein JWO06_492 [Bacteroidota bacterium]|nr:hypothetical protein [Bacteroidota bacterium]